MFVCIIYVDTDDFDVSTLSVTFDADDVERSVLIAIADDDKNEADVQSFIVSLEIEDAVNITSIIIRRASSICEIEDNDGESCLSQCLNSKFLP